MNSERSTKLFAWFNDRLGLEPFTKLVREKEVPLHRHTFWYYLGGMTLFLFVIMLIGVDKPDAYGPAVPAQRIMTAVVSVGLFASIALAGRTAWVTGSDAFGTPNLNGTIENVSDELFGTWTVVFLATVMLLTIAAVGTIALAYFGHEVEDEEAVL